MQRRYWSAAIPRYDSLIVSYPISLLMQTGYCHANLGHWTESARDMLRAIGSGSEDPFVWSKAALLCLKRRRRRRVRDAAERPASEYADLSDPWESNGVAYICSLVLESPRIRAGLVRSAGALSRPARQVQLSTIPGAALYRAGEFAQSVHELEEGIKLDQGRRSLGLAVSLDGVSWPGPRCG